MKKDLRGREALRSSVELTAFAAHPGFNDVKVADLRKLAELLEFTGAVNRITIETAADFGGTSRHRLQCARRALKTLAGEHHTATIAVAAALSALQHGRRQGTHHRDQRTREAILAAPHWTAFRTLPAAAETPLNELRAVDRFLLFCAENGAPGGELGSFLAFVEDKQSSMLLRTVRDGLEHLLSAAHPAVMVAEQARSLKEAERTARRKPKTAVTAKPRPLEHSVPYDSLPEAWRSIFATLLKGRKVRGRKYDAHTVHHMIYTVRQFAKSAYNAGLSIEFNFDTVRTYDADLEKRAVKPTSCCIYFTDLRTFGHLIGADMGLLDDLTDLIAYYEKASKSLVKVKERKLADLPDLAAIFKKANELLDRAEMIRDRRELAHALYRCRRHHLPVADPATQSGYRSTLGRAYQLHRRRRSGGLGARRASRAAQLLPRCTDRQARRRTLRSPGADPHPVPRRADPAGP